MEKKKEKICKFHGERLEFYCMDHTEEGSCHFICKTCLEDGHSGHSVITEKRLAEGIKEGAAEIVDNIRKEQEKFDNLLDELLAMKQKINKNSQSYENSRNSLQKRMRDCLHAAEAKIVNEKEDIITTFYSLVEDTIRQRNEVSKKQKCYENLRQKYEQSERGVGKVPAEETLSDKLLVEERPSFLEKYKATKAKFRDLDSRLTIHGNCGSICDYFCAQLVQEAVKANSKLLTDALGVTKLEEKIVDICRELIQGKVNEEKAEREASVAAAKSEVLKMCVAKVTTEVKARQTDMATMKTEVLNACTAKVTEEKTARETSIAAVKTEVLNACTTKVTEEKTARETSTAAVKTELLNTFTTKVTEEKTARENGIAAVKTDVLNTCTAKVTEEKTARETSIAATKTEVLNTCTAKVTEEKTARETSMAAVKTELLNVCTTKVAEEAKARDTAAAAVKTDVLNACTAKVTEEKTARETSLAAVKAEVLNVCTTKVAEEAKARDAGIAAAKTEVLNTCTAKVTEEAKARDAGIAAAKTEVLNACTAKVTEEAKARDAGITAAKTEVLNACTTKVAEEAKARDTAIGTLKAATDQSVKNVDAKVEQEKARLTAIESTIKKP